MRSMASTTCPKLVGEPCACPGMIRISRGAIVERDWRSRSLGKPRAQPDRRSPDNWTRDFSNLSGIREDYIDVRDVCAALASIALNGGQRVYNVASGVQTANARIAELLTRHFFAECVFQPNAPTVSFPPIDICA